MIHEHKRWLAAACVITALSTSVGASAQPNDGKAAAEALFTAGQRLLNEGKIDAACGKFEESERLDHALGTMLNIANCYEKGGRTASAWAMYREVANLAQTKHDANREAYATSHADSLAPRLSKLTITVTPDQSVDGLVIRRDGVQVGAALWGMPTPVDPGEHKVEVSAPGRRTWSTIAKVEADASQSTVTIPQLDSEPVAATPSFAPKSVDSTPARDEEHPATSSSQRTIGIAVAGAGVVGVVLGAAFGLVAKSKNNDALAHCVGNHCDAEGLSLTDSARGAATASTVAFVIGGAALAAGGVLFFTAPKSSPKGARLKVGPAIGSRTAGFTMGGSW
ncbi:MAG: hypothetical protein ABIP89_18480 [Polyangiaceae bacterium]